MLASVIDEADLLHPFATVQQAVNATASTTTADEPVKPQP
jgi:hypothetical protein